MNEAVLKIIPLAMVGGAVTLLFMLKNHNELMPESFVRLPPTASSVTLSTVDELINVAKTTTIGRKEIVLPQDDVELTIGSSTPYIPKLSQHTKDWSLPETPLEATQLTLEWGELPSQAAMLFTGDITGITVTAGETATNETLDDCTPLMRVDAETNATLRVLVSAPCNLGERIDVIQGPLKIAATIDQDGGYLGYLPALTQNPEVNVVFFDGVRIGGTDTVDNFSAFSHVSLISEHLELELHVFEGDPLPGAPGHLSAKTAKSDANIGAFRVTGIANGNSDRAAQTYTAPMMTQQDIPPLVSLEAEVTARTCGKALQGTLLHVEDGETVVLPIDIEMPDCDAIGEIVIFPAPL